MVKVAVTTEELCPGVELTDIHTTHLPSPGHHPPSFESIGDDRIPGLSFIAGSMALRTACSSRLAAMGRCADVQGRIA
jgi:hypothetical protein